MTQPQRRPPGPADMTTVGVAEHKGMPIEYVAVSDITDHPRHRATRAATRDEIAGINDRLRIENHWPAPRLLDEDGRQRLLPNNPVSEAMFDSAPALRLWREKLVPSAIALTALYDAEAWTLPTGEPIDARTRSYFIHSLDAVAVRKRAAIMSGIAGRLVDTGDEATRWTSIACGAAIPVLDAIGTPSGTAGVDLTLIDIDARALRHARDTAVARGLVESEHFELLRRDIIKDLIVSDRLVDEIGAQTQQLVDMLGIFEYIPEEYGEFKSAATFLANAFQLVKPGGVLIAANMLDTHPQLDFIQRAIGWPRLYPRSIEEIHRIIGDAGIDPALVTATIEVDGVYAVYQISKPDPARAEEPVAA